MARKRVNDMTVEEAVQALKDHDESVQAFYDDPMTHAMSVPTDDFQRDFDVRERALLAQIFDKAPKDSEEQTMALNRMEKFFP